VIGRALTADLRGCSRIKIPLRAKTRKGGAPASEEDRLLYLKYYADDIWRQQWQEDFPRPHSQVRRPTL
jgi:hypothetical protein